MLGFSIHSSFLLFISLSCQSGLAALSINFMRVSDLSARIPARILARNWCHEVSPLRDMIRYVVLNEQFLLDIYLMRPLHMGSASGVYWTHPYSIPCWSYANVFLTHIFCEWDFKLLTDGSQIAEISRLFHQLIALSEKKCKTRFVLIIFFFKFSIMSASSATVIHFKKSSNLTDDKPWTILHTSIKSYLIRLFLSDHTFSFANLSLLLWNTFQMWYDSCKTLLNFFNHCFVFYIVSRPGWCTQFQIRSYKRLVKHSRLAVSLHLAVRFKSPNSLLAFEYSCKHSWSKLQDPSLQ